MSMSPASGYCHWAMEGEWLILPCSRHNSCTAFYEQRIYPNPHSQRTLFSADHLMLSVQSITEIQIYWLLFLSLSPIQVSTWEMTRLVRISSKKYPTVMPICARYSVESQPASPFLYSINSDLENIAESLFIHAEEKESSVALKKL